MFLDDKEKSILEFKQFLKSINEQHCKATDDMLWAYIIKFVPYCKKRFRHKPWLYYEVIQSLDINLAKSRKGNVEFPNGYSPHLRHAHHDFKTAVFRLQQIKANCVRKKEFA